MPGTLQIVPYCWSCQYSEQTLRSSICVDDCIDCCYSHILHPLLCVLMVTNHSTHRNPVPTIRQAPLHTWTPMKYVRPSEFVLSSAPAIGAPMSDAGLCVSMIHPGPTSTDLPILDTLHDIPRRVPSRERSGVMFAKAAEGKVTNAAEKNPAVCQYFSLYMVSKSLHTP